MSRWRNTTDVLPPEGVSIVARWPDGATHHAILHQTPEAVIWEVEGDKETPPEAWRYAGHEAAGLMKANLVKSWWYPAMGLFVGGLIAMAAPLGGLLLIGGVLAVWILFSAFQSAGEAVAARRGGLSGLLLGAFVALAPMATIIAACLAFVVHLWRFYQ